ncbi:MAG: DNA/RNA non-specific endonuclease [Verrucomicrobia bacterium]|nr:DNA/RNA non-specific endonuclease [Verrucomicrobiota bacterium]
MNPHTTTPPSGNRSDIVSTHNESLSSAIQAVSPKFSASAPGRPRPAVTADRLQIRKNLVENPAADPNGYERILGKSDLNSINFLSRGLKAAAAVCRIKLPMEGGFSYGTGFLVGNRLLLTNNHVLASAAEASQAEAEFGYEHDLDGVLAEPVQFNLRPEEIFFTSVECDVTFVAVAPLSENGVPLDRYGRLPLLPISGKALPGEWVSIIQHPAGQPKQIAIRASEILALDANEVPDVNLEDFIHYSTDTEPGSSGSPVFNDQWQVVAIHHKAVPATRSRSAKESDEPRWIANEGVRISAVFQHLNQHRFDDSSANAVLQRLSEVLGLFPTPAPLTPSRESGTHEQFAPFPVARWNDARLGYNPGFLSVRIGLDDILRGARKKGLTAPLLKGATDELKYFRFSVVVHRLRKFALLTAVNIDGAKFKRIDRKDSWRPDARIAPEFQPADEFYVKSEQKEKVYFSRGHLVRLLDPSWGTEAEAKRGQEDTFHFTNSSPQVQGYNDHDWGNLEDYLLEKAQGTERKLTIFSGPVYRKDDPRYGHKRKGGPWQIPQSFWKVAVLQKSDRTVAVAAFIVGQTQYVKKLYEAKVFKGLTPYSVEELRDQKIQITLAALRETLGDLSPLDFSQLQPFEALSGLESTRQVRWVRGGDDILI